VIQFTSFSNILFEVCAASKVTSPEVARRLCVREPILILGGPFNISFGKSLNVLTRSRIDEFVSITVLFIHPGYHVVELLVILFSIHISEIISK